MLYYPGLFSRLDELTSEHNLTDEQAHAVKALLMYEAREQFAEGVRRGLRQGRQQVKAK